jgi:hypothetical protein
MSYAIFPQGSYRLNWEGLRYDVVASRCRAGFTQHCAVLSTGTLLAKRLREKDREERLQDQPSSLGVLPPRSCSRFA